MRSFKDILTESKKTYKFKIGVAGALPENFNDRLEMALSKFGLVSVSAGKKTPIQERPLDFPQLQNMEVTYFETEVEYPTTTQVLQEYLGDVCKVHQSQIVVRNPNEPLERIQDTKENEVYEPILTKEDMGGESAQNAVGENRVMDLLKELEKARKERTDATQEK
jgi:phosphoketolase